MIKRAISDLYAKNTIKILFTTIKSTDRSSTTILGAFSPYDNFATAFRKYCIFFFVLCEETQPAYR